jgi:hypothetical protein
LEDKWRAQIDSVCKKEKVKKAVFLVGEDDAHMAYSSWWVLASCGIARPKHSGKTCFGNSYIEQIATTKTMTSKVPSSIKDIVVPRLTSSRVTDVSEFVKLQEQ